MERPLNVERRWPLTPEQRVWGKVQKGQPDECWPWTGRRNAQGYGTTKVGNNFWLVTRLIWTWQHGEIPEGMCVLHRCDNPTCVNPAHLWLGTRTDNNRDRDRKGRYHGGRGERQWKAKLTETDVKAIRQAGANGIATGKLAAQFSVSTSTIRYVVQRTTWKHVK